MRPPRSTTVCCAWSGRPWKRPKTLSGPARPRRAQSYPRRPVGNLSARHEIARPVFCRRSGASNPHFTGGPRDARHRRWPRHVLGGVLSPASAPGSDDSRSPASRRCSGANPRRREDGGARGPSARQRTNGGLRPGALGSRVRRAPRPSLRSSRKRSPDQPRRRLTASERRHGHSRCSAIHIAAGDQSDRSAPRPVLRLDEQLGHLVVRRDRWLDHAGGHDAGVVHLRTARNLRRDGDQAVAGGQVFSSGSVFQSLPAAIRGGI